MFENPVNKAYVGGNQIIRAYNGDGAPHIYPIDSNISELLYYPGTGDTLTITFHHYGTNETTTKPKLYYRIGLYAINSGKRSFAENKWIEITGDTITVTATSDGISEYDFIQICGQGNTNFSNSEDDYTTILADGSNLNCVLALWQLETILDLDNPPTSIPDWCFYRFLYEGTAFEPSLCGVVTDATTLGNHTFENLMNNIYATQGLGIVMPNVINTQSDTFRNWIINCSSDGSKTINCPESLYLPENSNSGVPVGWYRINS